MSRALVTGATGFVGRATCARLQRGGVAVRAALRSPDRPVPPGAEPAVVGALGPATDWSAALAGVEVVIHLAARVHQMRDRAPDPLAAYREVNVAATERLARAAAGARVRRLVFVSSVKAFGDTREAPYTAADRPAPSDPYGQSKWEAEEALERLARETGLEVVVVRPPLVYGPGVGGNFLSLLRLVASGAPLPLGRVSNRRSLIYVENLADALVTLAFAPEAPGPAWLVSDGEDLSTPQLIRRIAEAMQRPARLVGVPPGLLRLVGAALGRQGAVERLLGSLSVDASAIGRTLGWRPPFTVSRGLAETVAWYRAAHLGTK